MKLIHITIFNIFLGAIKCITKKNIAKSQSLLSKEIKILKVNILWEYVRAMAHREIEIMKVSRNKILY